MKDTSELPSIHGFCEKHNYPIPIKNLIYFNKILQIFHYK